MTEPPVPITPIVGREAEITEVRRLLDSGCRILSLLGPGGVGKSRLAIEACRKPSPKFADGVAFVALERVGDASEVMRRVVDSVGATVEGAQNPLDVAIRHLSDRQMLLLIDNFEQVLEAGSHLTSLLEACPGVSAVVTSRRPLGVRGEHQLVVEPLALPSLASSGGAPRGRVDAVTSSPAVSLFVERAQRVHPDFVLDADNAVAVAEIVRRLDGLPLAIELAAARTKMLAPRQMLERFERGAVSLSAGHDVPARQQTLRATLEWSCALLTQEQQTLLGRLSVFADGATLEAIETVCGDAPVSDVLEDLSALLDNGLLRIDRDLVAGQPRFVMLLTVQEFAAEQLSGSGEAVAATTRFLEWALQTATLGDPVLHRDAPGRWPELVVEARNLRRAAELLLDAGDWQRFAKVAWGVYHWVFRFGDIRVYAALAERAFAQCGEAQAAAALSGKSMSAADRAAAARLSSGVSWVRFLVGDVAGSLAAQEGLDIDEVATSDPACAALLLNARAIALPLSDGGAAARKVAERSLALAESTRFDAVSAYTHAFLANLDLSGGDLASAEQHCRRCVVIANDIGLHAMAGQQYAVLGLVEIAQGAIDDARAHLVTALEAARIEASMHDAAVLLAHVAVLAVAEGREGDASCLRAISDATMTRLGLVHWPMLEDTRIAVMGGSPLEVDAVVAAEMAEADPWEALARELDPAPPPSE